MSPGAIVLANGHLDSVHGKTTHALVRGPSRYPLRGVIDPDHAGRDAGEVLDGKPRGIPVFASVGEALATLDPTPEVCVLGVANAGGVLPPGLIDSLRQAAAAGLTLVNGLHRLLGDIPELVELAERHAGQILDLRRPRPVSELRFWTGELLALETPRIAVIGTDCAVGKRTTATLLVEECRARGRAAEMIYTGQTGWMQGRPYGFILDATLNDFVSGELEGAILRCAAEARPDFIFLEGQSALRNPTGPCGAELLISGAARGVVLQHAPGRRWFIDARALKRPIPPIEEELELIRLLGSEVWAVTLHEEGLSPKQARDERDRLAGELGLPVALPLHDGVGEIVDAIEARTKGEDSR